MNKNTENKTIIDRSKLDRCGKFATNKAGSYNQVNNGVLQHYGAEIAKKGQQNYGDLMIEILDDGSENGDGIAVRGLELAEIICDSGHGIRQKTLGTHGEIYHVRPEEKNVAIKIQGVWLQNDGWRCIEHAFYRAIPRRYRISTNGDGMVLSGDFIVTDYSVGNREWGFPFGKFGLRSSGAFEVDYAAPATSIISV